MSLNLSILLIILGGAIVTFIPRVIPFIVIRNIGLPKIVVKWLSYIPICIFAALIVDSFIIQDDSLLSIDWRVLTAIVPTLIIALWTKSLSVTVIVGIVMDNSPDISSVLINGDKEIVWNAITNEDKLLQWYAPGSPWKIPNLRVGEKVTFLR